MHDTANEAPHTQKAEQRGRVLARADARALEMGVARHLLFLSQYGPRAAEASTRSVIFISRKCSIEGDREARHSKKRLWPCGAPHISLSTHEWFGRVAPRYVAHPLHATARSLPKHGVHHHVGHDLQQAARDRYREALELHDNVANVVSSERRGGGDCIAHGLNHRSQVLLSTG